MKNKVRSLKQCSALQEFHRKIGHRHRIRILGNQIEIEMDPHQGKKDVCTIKRKSPVFCATGIVPAVPLSDEDCALVYELLQHCQSHLSTADMHNLAYLESETVLDKSEFDKVCTSIRAGTPAPDRETVRKSLCLK